jgi:iron(III) transport system permease protein
MSTLTTRAPESAVTAAPPRYRRPLGVGREAWIQYAVLGLLAVLVLAPVVPTLYQSFLDRPLYEAGGILTGENYVKLFRDAGFGKVIVNTALFAVATTLITLVIAVPMAVVVVRTRIPFGRVFAAAMQWPFFISSLILGFGWITMYGPAGFVSTEVRRVLGTVPWNLYSIPGMALTEAVALAPIVYTFCAGALRQTDASLESAAQVCGAGPLRILRSVVVPMLRPPIVYSSILVISISVETLSVPLLYGTPVNISVFSTFLFRNGLTSITPDYGVLGAASTIILAVTVSLVYFQAKLLKNAQRFVSVRGKATRPRKLDLGWLKWASVTAITLYVVFGALIPIGGLMFRSFTLIFTPLQSPLKTLTGANSDRIFHFPVYVQSIRNSLIVAGAGAVLVGLLALIAVLVARRSSFRFGGGGGVSRAGPAVHARDHRRHRLVLGLRVRPAGHRSDPGHAPGPDHRLRPRALPTGFGSIAPGVMQLGQELDNAAVSPAPTGCGRCCASCPVWWPHPSSGP